MKKKAGLGLQPLDFEHEFAAPGADLGDLEVQVALLLHYAWMSCSFRVMQREDAS